MTLYGAVGEVERKGKEVVTASGDFDSAGEATISTPFANIDAVIVTVNKATAPTTQQVTYSVSGSTVTLHAWKATAAGNTALTASDAGESYSVMIIGRRRQ